MSKKVVKDVLERFLESQKPQVIAITGSWGVGKTTALKHILENYRGTCPVKKYGYTSIFGAQSIGEVRTSLLSRWRAFPVLNDVEIALAPRRKRFFRWLSARRDKYREKANLKQAYESLREVAPYGGKYMLFAAESLAGSLVSNMLVVIDDVERIGEKVSFEMLLGFVAELRDQRQCKVILILNEGGFRKPDDLALFERYSEKVVDLKLTFELDAAESIELGLASDTPLRDSLIKVCDDLNLRNIRVLQRIEMAMKMIYPIVADLSPVVHQQLATSIGVFACALYERGRGFPTLETILRFNSLQRAVEQTQGGVERPSPFDGEWTDLVVRAGYESADDFDIEVANIMQRGYADGSPARTHAEAINNIVNRGEKERKFSDAWSLFRDRLDSTDEQIATALVEAVRDAADVISPINLDATVRLLRELGRHEQADAIIEIYIAEWQHSPRQFDVERISHIGTLTDSYLRQRFTRAYSASNSALSLQDAAALIIENTQWDEGIVPAFLSASSEDIVRLLEQNQGPRLRDLISGFSRLPIQDAERELVRERVRSAMQQLAGRSRVNQVRVQYWGYDFTVPESNAG